MSFNLREYWNPDERPYFAAFDSFKERDAAIHECAQADLVMLNEVRWDWEAMSQMGSHPPDLIKRVRDRGLTGMNIENAEMVVEEFRRRLLDVEAAHRGWLSEFMSGRGIPGTATHRTLWTDADQSQLNRLLDHLEFYEQSIKKAKGIEDLRTRAWYLWDNVFDPLLTPDQRRNLRDPKSDRIQSGADMCQPTVLLNHMKFGYEMTSWHRYAGNMAGALAESTYKFGRSAGKALLAAGKAAADIAKAGVEAIKGTLNLVPIILAFGGVLYLANRGSKNGGGA